MKKGIYVLVILISRNITINVGALGVVRFKKGFYAYVGSAQNHLEKRVERHFKKGKRKFWHIDYLLDDDAAKILKVFYKEGVKSEECKIAKEIGKEGMLIKGFGSSDCSCKSHLFKIDNYDFLKELMHEVKLQIAFGVIRLESGWCVWITGLPGSGKSVVSEALLKILKQRNIHVQLLSSDALRKILTPKPKYSLEERDSVYATLVYIAELLTQNGVNIIIDATGNLRRYRDNARKKFPKFIEAYLECPLDVCMERESKRERTRGAPKQIYNRALKGEAPTVPGVGQPYEPPINPEITIDTTQCTPEECAQKILEIILKRYP